MLSSSLVVAIHALIITNVVVESYSLSRSGRAASGTILATIDLCWFVGRIANSTLKLTAHYIRIYTLHYCLIITPVNLICRIQNSAEIRRRRFVWTSEHPIWHRQFWPRTQTDLWVTHLISAIHWDCVLCVVVENKLQSFSTRKRKWSHLFFPVSHSVLSFHFFLLHASRHACRITFYIDLSPSFSYSFLLPIWPSIHFSHVHSTYSTHFCLNQHSRRRTRPTSGSKESGRGRPVGGTSPRGQSWQVG